jgi:hypothetical protein
MERKDAFAAFNENLNMQALRRYGAEMLRRR